MLVRIRVRRRPGWRIAAAIAALIALLCALSLAGAPPGAIDVTLKLAPGGSARALAEPHALDVAAPESGGLPDAPAPLAAAACGLSAPETIRVYDHRAGVAFDMDFEEYIYCVTASEMPALRELEALKAQAVAARTYALGKLASGGCGRGGADICTDSGHCQAFHARDELMESWGGDADRADARVRRAVEQTRGLILTYEGEPINALFHASSGGHTEDVENVYSQALPYLRGVSSPGEEDYSGYYSTRAFTRAEFCARAEELGCELDADLPLMDQVRIEALTDAGQVALLRIGGGALTGREARKAFSLRSQRFELAFDGEGGVTFEVYGFGHGVGMSQNGADAMARAGCGFDEILRHYYTGVELTRLSAEPRTAA